tara:strand:- start:570 stop:1418 length:849 start_codon:yes stop_codon:yes gene_type:complete
MNTIINKNLELDQLAKGLNYNYSIAKPFPHCVIDDLLNPELLNQITKEFLIKNGSHIDFNNPNEKKTALNNWGQFGPQTKKIIKYLNGQTFISFLEKLTGIENLISDNNLEGGGLHEISRGGYLKIHADFNKHSSLDLDRRLNVLIYLNKDWQSQWGGDFEMWSKDMKSCIKKVSPVFNRTVIFSTTDYSYHGHPNPLMCPKGLSRKSIALYYFSHGRPLDEIQEGLEYHSTLFVKRKISKKDRWMFIYNLINKLKFKNIVKLLLPAKYIDLIIKNRRGKNK